MSQQVTSLCLVARLTAPVDAQVMFDYLEEREEAGLDCDIRIPPSEEKVSRICAMLDTIDECGECLVSMKDVNEEVIRLTFFIENLKDTSLAEIRIAMVNWYNGVDMPIPAIED